MVAVASLVPNIVLVPFGRAVHLFEEAGIEEPPTTWDELVTAAKALPVVSAPKANATTIFFNIDFFMFTAPKKKKTHYKIAGTTRLIPVFLMPELLSDQANHLLLLPSPWAAA